VQPIQEDGQRLLGEVGGERRVGGPVRLGLLRVDLAGGGVALGVLQHRGEQLGPEHGLAEEVVRSQLDGHPVEMR
jgi:hypothetical protein